MIFDVNGTLLEAEGQGRLDGQGEREVLARGRVNGRDRAGVVDVDVLAERLASQPIGPSIRHAGTDTALTVGN